MILLFPLLLSRKQVNSMIFLLFGVQMRDGWKHKENLVDRVVALYRQKAIKPPP